MSTASLVLALAGISFMLTVIWGTPLLRLLRHFKIGKLIRVDEPGHHNVKMGTPTMGGVLFILPVLLLTGLLNAGVLIGLEVIGRSVLVPLIVMVGYGSLGALDDWEGLRGKRRGEGMRARTKFLAQVVLALGYDRGNVSELSADGATFMPLASWARPGIQPHVQPLDRRGLPWYVGELLAMRMVCLSRLPDQLPDDALPERAFVKAIGLGLSQPLDAFSFGLDGSMIRFTAPPACCSAFRGRSCRGKARRGGGRARSTCRS